MSNDVLYVSTFMTPCGAFSVALDDAGALVATAFGDPTRLRSRLKCRRELITDESHLAAPVRREVARYFSGELQTFSVPINVSGTSFQKRVWSALGTIPFGETRSYGQLAAELGNPAASRAIGRANATNPVCLIVPCHRVIGADGSLTGFAFGEDVKRQLLAHEGALLPSLI